MDALFYLINTTFFCLRGKLKKFQNQILTRKKSDDLFWRFNERPQESQQSRHQTQSSDFRESIPSMRYTPINANSQRAVFEHMNHGPVPVRGAQLQGGHRPSNPQPIESRQFLQNTAIFQTFQTLPGSRPQIGQFQPEGRPTSVRGQEQDGGFSKPRTDSSSLGIVPHAFRQQQFSPVPATSFSPQPNNRLPNTNRPHLTGTQFNGPPLPTDNFDGSNDEQPQQPTLDWNQHQQAHHTLRQSQRRYKDMTCVLTFLTCILTW